VDSPLHLVSRQAPSRWDGQSRNRSISHTPRCRGSDRSFKPKSSAQRPPSLDRAPDDREMVGIDVIHAQRPQSVPAVLTKPEAIAVIVTATVRINWS